MIVASRLASCPCDVRLGTQIDFLPAFPNSHSHSLLLTQSQTNSHVGARTTHDGTIRPQSSAESRRGAVKLAPRLYSLQPCQLIRKSFSSRHLLARLTALQIEKQYVSSLCGWGGADGALTIARRYKFVVKAVEHAQVRPGHSTIVFANLQTVPKRRIGTCRRRSSARIEAHKVTKTKKETPPTSWVARFTLLRLS